MLDQELQDLRRELAALERGRGKRYPKPLRDRIVAWARRQGATGSAMRASATKLALHPETLRTWIAQRPAPAAPMALVPVEVVVAPPTVRRISVVSPGGFLVDDLTHLLPIGTDGGDYDLVIDLDDRRGRGRCAVYLADQGSTDVYDFVAPDLVAAVNLIVDGHTSMYDVQR